MCHHCSQVITALVRANLVRNVATDVYRLARELHRDMPHKTEADLVGLIDATVINTWGAAAIWDRSAPGTDATAPYRIDAIACARATCPAPHTPGPPVMVTPRVHPPAHLLDEVVALFRLGS